MTSIVHNMDCMELMQQYPDKYFDLAVVDIPYGIGVGKMSYLKEIKTTVKQKNGTRLNANRNKKAYTQKEWDKETPSQQYFNELKRISREQIIFGIEYVSWQGVGAGRIIWDKGVPDGMSFKQCELAYCSMINEVVELPLLWSGMCQAKSLSEPMKQQGNKQLNEKRIHPTQKPIALYRWIYKNYLPNGGKVIDTHLGSGSNRIAADKAGNIDFVAAELDKDYFEAQEKRWREYKAQLKLW